VDVEVGETFSEERLDGIMVDHARLLLGDSHSLGHHSLDLETSWGDGIFPVVVELGREGQILLLRVELGDEQRQQPLRNGENPDRGIKYDDASWHAGVEFPEVQPQELGGTHTALFLRWCFCKGWSGPIFDEPELVARVALGQLSATEFLFKYSDGKLLEEMLNEAGNAFA